MGRYNIDGDNAHIVVPVKSNFVIYSNATEISFRDEQQLRLSSLRDFEWRPSLSVSLQSLKPKYVSLERNNTDDGNPLIGVPDKSNVLISSYATKISLREEQPLRLSFLRDFEWRLRLLIILNLIKYKCVSLRRENINYDNAHMAVPVKSNFVISSDANEIFLRDEQLRWSSLRDSEWRSGLSISLQRLNPKYVSLGRDNIDYNNPLIGMPNKSNVVISSDVTMSLRFSWEMNNHKD